MSEKAPVSPEEELIRYPLLEVEEPIYSVEPEYYFRVCVDSGKLYKIQRKSMFASDNGIFVDYALKEKIGNEDFIFRMVKAFGGERGVYSIDFFSEKYKYALMNFTKDEITKLEQTVISFIHTIMDTDSDVTTIRFMGAGSSYTKDDIDNAKGLLINDNYQGYTDEEIDSMDPNEISSLLYRNEIKGTKLQEANNNLQRKREKVFSYRLKKLFEKYNLPYQITKEGGLSDVHIERKS